MQIIYKYPLPQTINEIELSLGAKILHIGLQNKEFYAWILCDPDSEFKEKRFIESFFTGEKSEKLNLAIYLATIVGANDSFLVFHWFDTTNYYRKQNNKIGG